MGSEMCIRDRSVSLPTTLRSVIPKFIMLLATGMEETLVRVIMRGLPKDDEIHRILGILSASADSFEESES